jgi:hypothetical protein
MTLNFGGSVAPLVRSITLSHGSVPHLNDVSQCRDWMESGMDYPWSSIWNSLELESALIPWIVEAP